MHQHSRESGKKQGVIRYYVKHMSNKCSFEHRRSKWRHRCLRWKFVLFTSRVLRLHTKLSGLGQHDKKSLVTLLHDKALRSRCVPSCKASKEEMKQFAQCTRERAWVGSCPSNVKLWSRSYSNRRLESFAAKLQIPILLPWIVASNLQNSKFT